MRLGGVLEILRGSGLRDNLLGGGVCESLRGSGLRDRRCLCGLRDSRRLKEVLEK